MSAELTIVYVSVKQQSSNVGVSLILNNLEQLGSLAIFSAFRSQNYARMIFQEFICNL